MKPEINTITAPKLGGPDGPTISIELNANTVPFAVAVRRLQIRNAICVEVDPSSVMVIPVGRPLVGQRSVIPPATYADSFAAAEIECLPFYSTLETRDDVLFSIQGDNRVTQD